MGRSTPLWIWFVVLFLALDAVRLRVPVRMPAEARQRARELVVERDPHRMNARELRQLPGVGNALALAIARTRDAQPASGTLAWEDVPGIGAERARGIRAWCRAAGIEPDPLRAGAPEGRAAESYPPGVHAALRAISWTLGLFLAGCGGAGSEHGARAEAPSSANTVVPAAPDVRPRALLGGALHALDAGPNDGAPVLLLHGARFSAETWKELGTLELLARSGRHAVAIDWPGYGATPAWSSEPEAATLLQRVFDELGFARATLVAPSLGGRFALEFLSRSPARVAALVAIAPAGADTFEPGPTDVPVLLVWGERDEIVPLERGRALAARWKDARLEVLSAAGHPCYLDQPQRFHALLLEFLASTAAAEHER